MSRQMRPSIALCVALLSLLSSLLSLSAGKTVSAQDSGAICGSKARFSAGLTFAVTLNAPAAGEGPTAQDTRATRQVLICIANVSASANAQIGLDLRLSGGATFQRGIFRGDAFQSAAAGTPIVISDDSRSARLNGLRYDVGQADTFALIMTLDTDTAGVFQLTPFITLNGAEVEPLRAAAVQYTLNEDGLKFLDRDPNAAMQATFVNTAPGTQLALNTANDSALLAILIRNRTASAQTYSITADSFGNLRLSGNSSSGISSSTSSNANTDPARRTWDAVTLQAGEARVYRVQVAPGIEAYPGRYNVRSTLTVDGTLNAVAWSEVAVGSYHFPAPVLQTDQRSLVQSGIYLAGLLQPPQIAPGDALKGGELLIWVENASDAVTRTVDLTVRENSGQLAFTPMSARPAAQTVLDYGATLVIRRVVLGPREGAYLTIQFGVVRPVKGLIPIGIQAEETRVGDRPAAITLDWAVLE